VCGLLLTSWEMEPQLNNYCAKILQEADEGIHQSSTVVEKGPV
jgi:hypothetical protein